MTREETIIKIIGIIKGCSELDDYAWDEDGDYPFVYADAELAAERILKLIEENGMPNGPSPITVIKRAFDAGMSAATYNGHPGMPDAPKFEEWYSKWHKDVTK